MQDMCQGSGIRDRDQESQSASAHCMPEELHFQKAEPCRAARCKPPSQVKEGNLADYCNGSDIPGSSLFRKLQALMTRSTKSCVLMFFFIQFNLVAIFTILDVY